MGKIANRLLLLALLALAGVGWPDAAAARSPAAQPPGAQPRLGPEWVALSPALLDGYRGGYQLPSGLLLSFGIERVALVNGQVVSFLRVDIPDIAHMTEAQARDLAKLNETQLVQVGDGNVFRGAGGGLVIQNTLDGQDIRARTTLDVGVGTLGLFQALNATEALRNASMGTPGAP